MAKVQNPVIGRTKGSAGGMTFAKVYDKNVMKAKVFEVNNPKTAAQTIQRDYFKTVSAQAAVLTPDQLRAIFPNKPKAMSRRNALTQQLAEYWEMVESNKVMKLSDLVTVGNAKTMDMGETTAAIAGNLVTVTLSNKLKNNALLGDNYFVAMLVNVTQNLINLDITSDKVSVGAISIGLPESWDVTDTVQAIPLILDTKTAPTSWGTMSVTERPARP